MVLVFAIRNHGSDTTRQVVADLADAISTVVKWVIKFAPLGIFGLVASTVAETGFGALASYAQLLAVLLGCMLFIALVVNPLIVWWKIRRNPYPLVLTCLRESGVTAFFTRSSAANIPVNMALATRPAPPIRFPFRWAQPSTWPVQRLPSPYCRWRQRTPWVFKLTS